MSDEKPPDNPLTTTVAYIVCGLGGIVVAAGRLVNPIYYPPSDARSTDAFVISSTIFILAFALLFLVAGLVRLVRRPK